MCRFYVKNYRLFDGDGDRLEEEQLDWQYTVNRTWGGQTLDAASHSVVTVSLDDVWIEVSIDAPFNGDPRPKAPAGSTWELWEHEVVELFLLGTDEQYLEVELGPHGHHLILTLKGVRNIVSRHAEITYQTTLGDARWSGVARLPRSLLPPGPLRANAFRITGPGSTRGYYATYPSTGAQPDFHSLETYRPLQWS